MAMITEHIFNFNPHEREARDHTAPVGACIRCILIHTSVKLVTAALLFGRPLTKF